jgi:spectinomycin phosphotransferase
MDAKGRSEGMNQMLTESKIDKSLLKKVIQEKFGISVISLTPVPKWKPVRAYVVESPKHTNFFLKIYSDDSIPDSAFRFAHDLYAKAGITNITHPVATSNGQMRIQLGDTHIALFDLISGTTAEQHNLSEKQLERLGELLASIHQSKAMIGEYSVRERFEIPFRDRLVAIFNDMSKISSNSTNYKARLKFFLEPHRQKFMKELETLGELQRKVRRKNLEFVNCHGEPSPGNVLASNSGEVYLLDWDDPIFAPKEKDLLFFKDSIEPVMKGYSLFSKDINLDQDVMAFYGHMWNLGEIVDYGGKILFENHSDEQNQTWSDNLKGGWDFTF